MLFFIFYHKNQYINRYSKSDKIVIFLMSLESLFCSINESNSFLLCPITIRVYSQATLYAICYIKRGKKENSSCFYYSCVDHVTSHFISWHKIVTVWNRHFSKYLKKNLYDCSEIFRIMWVFFRQIFKISNFTGFSDTLWYPT